ncbi:uncharacterized protein PITG_05417 [Phytophthora infestans T30-4]|uniref:Uncharacterized protein n=1 Tax=Phytophthora infestans (strain T30-4) TaxID=403677 RepID=D0N2S2_PHYIT|nr:uncharacterized protein PITG_05417 [Phytophthora infestans T30-4]EEY69214.1 hypothetical protein PITG_05417 [Phytophthora infestans T30-4]|eukprot:XP_002999068.1 hypothetical protein PITG_05417 [Phytophthora infestans T30-4]
MDDAMQGGQVLVDANYGLVRIKIQGMPVWTSAMFSNSPAPAPCREPTEVSTPAPADNMDSDRIDS